MEHIRTRQNMTQRGRTNTAQTAYSTSLSPEDRARLPELEKLGNHSWLAKVQGGNSDSGIPVVSTRDFDW